MYHVIYPIFFKNEDDQMLFFILLENKLAWEAGRALNSYDHYKTIVYTDNKRIKEMAESQGLWTYFSNVPNSDMRYDLPFGSSQVINRLINGDSALLSNSHGIALVDYRSPDTTVKEIKKILEKLKEQPGIWVALSEPEDHPVQFKIYLETLDVELHMKRDEKASQCLAASVSKPFHLCCQLQDIKIKENNFLRVPVGGLCSNFELISKKQAMDEIDRKSFIIKYSAEGLGRRVIGNNAPWPTNAFIPFGGYIDESTFLIIPSPNSSEIEIFITPLPQSNYKLSVFAANNAKIDSSPILDHWFSNTDKLKPFHVKGIVYVGPIIKLRPPSCDGLLLTIERQVYEGRASTSMPLIMEDAGWTIDDTDNIAINTRNNRRISGRQDFPTVYEYDSSLIALQPKELAQLETPDFMAGAYGYKMNQKSSIARALHLNFNSGQNQKLISEISGGNF